ncbi:hypothetical protein PISMIDRAFT_673109 [Pisolithus microcarpus 441]|uniref:Unplaced genomic scaffold scaffold_7, whole genome shotgun sequence n=1 Tax=Pisolithus microcarpus 441 TaxID=765257 RepID=A0A0D0AA49_9AGAM|nr:hypothetical protein PISMIDRAFT_673109 [Pisolithus microcarpus 441]
MKTKKHPYRHLYTSHSVVSGSSTKGPHFDFPDSQVWLLVASNEVHSNRSCRISRRRISRSVSKDELTCDRDGHDIVQVRTQWSDLFDDIFGESPEGSTRWQGFVPSED